MFIFPFVTGLIFLHECFAWGNVGHRTTAYIASKYLDSATHSFLSHILEGEDLSDAAVWADIVSKTDEYQYTRPWHFVNVYDTPPSRCGLDISRDHIGMGGDIISAFVNHSSILYQNKADFDLRREAMKFMLHWFGDIHQPLHVEGLEKGGTGIAVKFDGEVTTLHSVWDVQIIAKYRGQNTNNEKQIAKQWAEEIFASHSISHKDEDYSHTKDPYLSALQFANMSNAYICQYVLKLGIDDIRGQELAGQYYANAIPVVERLIWYSGRRLATWLNQVAHQQHATGNSWVVDGRLLHLQDSRDD